MSRTAFAPFIRALGATVALAGVIAACDLGGDDPVDPVQSYLDVELVAEGLTAPVLLREAPDQSGRLFVVDQVGRIRVIEGGQLMPQPFLDVSASMVDLDPSYDERGLLGLAFHPDYDTNGRFYVYYSAPLRPEAPEGWNHTSRISEFTVSGDPDVADPASERIVLEVDQPQSNHNGGTVAFGPEGMLYISLGDGGGANDEGMGHVEDWYEENAGGNGQDIQANLLGSILRVDVDGGEPYAVPPANPFVGFDGLDEIWAYGFRNPYRFSFDLGSGELIAADVGQNSYEEIDLVEAGGNYGWNVREGDHCFSTERPDEPPQSCPLEGGDGEDLVRPVFEYPQVGNGGRGVAVIGGFVYRGDDIPPLNGGYVFGDYSETGDRPSGLALFATPIPTGPWLVDEIRFGVEQQTLGEYLMGMGQDLGGEVYFLTSLTGAPSGFSGKVYKLTVEAVDQGA